MDRNTLLTAMEARFQLPTGPDDIVTGPGGNKWSKRRLAVETRDEAWDLFSLSEQWATGSPTKRELRQHVKLRLLTKFGGVIGLLWLAFRIWRWVDFIWDLLDTAGNDPAQQRNA